MPFNIPPGYRDDGAVDLPDEDEVQAKIEHEENKADMERDLELN